MIENEIVVAGASDGGQWQGKNQEDQIERLFRTDDLKPLCHKINLCVEEVVKQLEIY